MTARALPRSALEDLLAELRRLDAALDAAEARLGPGVVPEEVPPPLRTLHRVPPP